MVFEPDDVGLSSQRLQRMRDAFQGDIDKGIVPGVSAGCRKMVGATGIEPVTPSMSRRCSSAELRALKP